MAGRMRTHRATLAEMGIEWWCNHVSAGGLVQPELTKRGIPAGVFYKWVNEPENASVWASAKAASSHALGERAMQVALEVDDPKEAALAKLKHDALKWFAKVRNPSEYGDKQQIDLKAEVSVGTLHLTAMKHAHVFRAQQQAQPLPEPEADYVVLPEAEPEPLEVDAELVIEEPIGPSLALGGEASPARDEPAAAPSDVSPRPAVENVPTAEVPKTRSWGRGRPRKPKQDN